MRALVDTNIVVDFLRGRKPFDAPAAKLLVLARLGEIELWISPSQMGDLSYLLTEGGKPSYADVARSELKQIRQLVKVCMIGQSEIDDALDSSWSDLEDAFLYQAALRVKADAIITRNTDDFKQATIKVLDCDGLFAYLETEQGLTYDFNIAV